MHHMMQIRPKHQKMLSNLRCQAVNVWPAPSMIWIWDEFYPGGCIDQVKILNDDMKSRAAEQHEDGSKCEEDDQPWE